MRGRRHYFFVYLVNDGEELNLDLPCGGVTVSGDGEIEVCGSAYNLAEARYPRRPWQTLCVVEAFDLLSQRHVRILELDKIAEDRKFRELMRA